MTSRAISTATLFLAVVASSIILAAIPSLAHAQAGSQLGGFERITDAELRALRCRGVDFSALPGNGGIITAQARQVLGITSSNPTAQNDWCLFLVERHDPGPDSRIGLANPKVEGVGRLHPEFGQRLMRFFQAAESMGHQLRIHSGFRTCESQKAIFATAQRGYAAKGCNSSHNVGTAVDINFNGQFMPKDQAGIRACAANPACKWAHENANGYGLNFRIRNIEVWHLEPLGALSDAASGIRTAAFPSNSNNSNARPSIYDILSGSTAGRDGSLIGTSAAQSPLSNLFSSLFGSFGSNENNLSQQPASGGSQTKNTVAQTGTTGASTVFHAGVAINETEAPIYAILTEDGTVVATSTESVEDAIRAAGISGVVISGATEGTSGVLIERDDGTVEAVPSPKEQGDSFREFGIVGGQTTFEDPPHSDETVRRQIPNSGGSPIFQWILTRVRGFLGNFF